MGSSRAPHIDLDSARASDADFKTDEARANHDAARVPALATIARLSASVRK